MAKAAIVLLAGTDSHADLGRAVNAISTARQFQDAGDEVTFIFDGAGTEWVPRMTDPEDKLNESYTAIEKDVHGACAFCAKAFGVKEQVEEAGIALLDESHDHPDLHAWAAKDYQIIPF